MTLILSYFPSDWWEEVNLPNKELTKEQRDTIKTAFQEVYNCFVDFEDELDEEPFRID